jgi:hypothetical protein
LRVIEGRVIQKAIRGAFRYTLAHVERIRPNQSRWPASGQLPSVLHAFVRSTEQLYEGVVALLADRNPRNLSLAAGVVVRAAVEGLGNVLALLEDPAIGVPVLLRDHYCNSALILAHEKERRGDSEPFRRAETNLRRLAEHHGITPDEAAALVRGRQPWPMPKDLLNGKSRDVRIRGERLAVFREVHGAWYRHLSGLAHHRLAALQVAVGTEEHRDEGKVAMVKSVTYGLSATVSVCVILEALDYCQEAPSEAVREAWRLCRALDETAKEAGRLRYDRLLGE